MLLPNAISPGRVVALGSFDPAAVTLFDSVEAEDYTYLPYYQKTATNNLIVSLRNTIGNIYENHIGDAWFYLGGNADGAQHSVKGNTITWLGTIDDKNFSAYGFEPDGTAGEAGDTGWIPSVEIASKDDCGFASHSVKARGFTAQTAEMGTYDGSGSGRWRFIDSPTIPNSVAQIGDGADSVTITSPATDALYMGNKIVNRTGAASMKYWVDGVEKVEQTTLNAAGTLSTKSLYVGGNRNNTTVNLVFNGRISYTIAFKKSLSDAQIAEFNTIIDTWLLAMGRKIQPAMYEYAAAISLNNHKEADAFARAWVESEMTDVIWAKVKQWHSFSPKSAADSVLNKVDPATYALTHVGTTDLQGNGIRYRTTSGHSTGGVKFSDEATNDWTMGCYTQHSTTLSNNRTMIGATGAGGDSYLIYLTGGKIRYRVAATQVEWVRGSIEDDYGMVSGGKVGLDSWIRVRGAIVATKDNHTGTGRCVDACSVAGQNNGGTPSNNMQTTTSGVYAAYNISQAENLICDTMMEAEMKYRGISVLENAVTDTDGVGTYMKNVFGETLFFDNDEHKAKEFAIKDAINLGVFDEIDLFQLWASREQSDANLILDLKGGNSFGGAIINSINRDIKGATGNGTNMAINTGWHGDTDSVNYDVANRDTSVHYRLTTAPSTHSGMSMGENNDAAGSSRIKFEPGASVTNFRMNNTQNLGVSILLADLHDMTVSQVREVDAADGRYIYINGEEKAQSAVDSTGTPASVDHYAFVSNRNSIFSNYTDAGEAGLIMGSRLVTHAKARTIFDNYLLRLKGFEVPLAS